MERCRLCERRPNAFPNRTLSTCIVLTVGARTCSHPPRTECFSYKHAYNLALGHAPTPFALHCNFADACLPSFSTMSSVIPNTLALQSVTVAHRDTLRLPRPSDTAGAWGTVGDRAVFLARRHRLGRRLASAETSPRIANCGDLLVFHFDQCTRSPSTALACRLLVGSGVEPNEEHQVRGENRHASEGSKFLARADTHSWEVGEVGGAEVGIGGEVDETEVDDELQDLEHGDVLLPPNANTARRLEVVPVHDNVDCEVEGNWYP